jgi:CrcB protein
MSDWSLWLGVAVSGALGAASRYALSRLLTARHNRPRLGVIVANMLGTFLAGAVFALDHPIAPVLALGFAGSLTTFSTIVTWMAADANQRDHATASRLLFVHVFLGIPVAIAGFTLGELVWGNGLG